MNKQKALHALRGLEMTFEQKQELINALAEGDNAGGGGNNTGKVIIDITSLKNGNGAEMSITEDQLNAILTQNVIFCKNDAGIFIILYVSQFTPNISYEDPNIYIVTQALNRDDDFLEFTVWINRLSISTPLIG